MRSVARLIALAAIAVATPALSSCGQQDDAALSKVTLGAVRVFAADKDLNKLEASAAKVEWTRHERDRPGSSLIHVPEHYEPARLSELLDAFQRARVRKMEMRMIASNGMAVDGDGRLVEDK